MIDSAHVADGAFSLHAIAGLGSRERFPEFKAAVSSRDLGVFADGGKVILRNCHQLYRVQEGKIRFDLGGSVGGQDRSETLVSGESIMVPAGVPFRYEIVSAYGRMYAFNGKGGGLEKVFEELGRKGEEQEVVGDQADVKIAGKVGMQKALEKIDGCLA